MSLDVYLMDQDGNELYWANITHNLNKIADAAGMYEVLWRPDEHGFERAGQIAPKLKDGLIKLTLAPSEFKQYEPSNGWGKWENFVPWVARYLEACQANPDAFIRVSR